VEAVKLNFVAGKAHVDVTVLQKQKKTKMRKKTKKEKITKRYTLF